MTRRVLYRVLYILSCCIVYRLVMLCCIVDSLVASSSTDKRWKHNHVFEILRRGMPKYELVTQTMHRRVLNALFLLDSDRMRQESDDDDDGEDEEDNVGNNVPDRNDEDTERPPATDNHPAVNALTVVPPPCTPATARGFVLTPRPSIGKKRAKVLAQQAAAIKLKKKEPAAADVPSVNQLLKHRQNESLERLALASEAKANVAKEQYMFNFHMKFPTSAASIA